jgi:hypothetical protein
MIKIKFLTYQEVFLTEVSSLVQLDFIKSKFSPFKLDQRNSGLVLLVFWFSSTSENYGFTFWEFYPLKGYVEGAKEFPRLGHTFLDDFWDEIPLQ